MTIKKLTVDSSVLVSLLTKNEEYFDYSKKFIDYVFENKIVIVNPAIILFELFHNLRKAGYFKDLYSYVKFKQIFNSDCFQYFNLDVQFFNLFKGINYFDNLKTSDAIIATSAFLAESLLISWDKTLLKNCYHGCTPKRFLETFAN